MSLEPSPILFSEIMDLIVEEVAQTINQTERIRTLSSIALTSNANRTRAYGHIFAKVNLAGTTSHMQSIRQFRDIVEADTQLELVGVASFIRAFGLNMGGFESKLVRTVNDGTLTTILNKLLKSGETTGGGSTREGLFSMSLWCIEPSTFRGNTDADELDPSSGVYPFDWHELQPDFLEALYRLLRSPSITTVHLANLRNIPPSLLKNTFINHVFFKNVLFQTVWGNNVIDGATSTDYGKEKAIKSISTNEINLPWGRILNPEFTDGSPREPTFSTLENLEFTVHAYNRQDILSAWRKFNKFLLKAGSNLQRLTVGFAGLYNLDSNSPVPLNFQTTPNLRKLTICNYGKVRQQRDFEDIRLVLHQSQFPSRLQDLEISFVLETGRHIPGEVFFYRMLGLRVLDKFFSRPQFHTLSSLTFVFHLQALDFHQYLRKKPANKDDVCSASFDMEQFLADTRDCFRLNNVFPLVSSLHHVFRFEIVISPNFSKRFDAHHAFAERYVL